MQDESCTIAENVHRVRERVAKAAERAGRSPGSVRLIAVTKTRGVDQVKEALLAGVQDFGENYVQEARTKIPAVQESSLNPAQWHLIGRLQSNKAKYCIGLFSLVQSLDSVGLAQELARQAAKRGETQRVLIEVNLSGEAQRAGASPTLLSELTEQILALPGLRLEGLMGVAPVTETVEATRPHFRELYRFWETLPVENRRTLSMGMSGDFEVAIEEGATDVRIGTALFGRRGPG